MSKKNNSLFSALLKFWRGQRGMSQLDLALASDVSSRHISFLETGRAQPSEEMILRIATTLSVPLRNQNEMLRAAGFDQRFDEPDLNREMPTEIKRALDAILSVNNPYPIMVMNETYDILRVNHATQRLLAYFVADPNRMSAGLNAYRLLFDPGLARPYVVDWPQMAQKLLSRLHRESLNAPGNPGFKALLDDLLTYPEIPSAWRYPNFDLPAEPVYLIHLKNGEIEASFLTTVTMFSAPGNITLEELRIETYFPLDDKTDALCRGFAD
ncbi:MAG: helix-turn-helix transcriptional regulator [Chloroflexota bacterium]